METSAQCVIYNFGIDQAVPLEGTISFAELGHKVGLPENRVRSIVRCSMVSNIFAEPFPNEVAHTPASALLVHDPPMRDLYGHFLEECFPITPKLAEAWKRDPMGVIQNQSAFNVAFNTTDPVFEFLQSFPDRVVRFGGAMTAVSKLPGYSLDHIVRGYDWGSLNEGGGGGKVVDVRLFFSFSLSVLSHFLKKTNLGWRLYRLHVHRPCK